MFRYSLFKRSLFEENSMLQFAQNIFATSVGTIQTLFFPYSSVATRGSSFELLAQGLFAPNPKPVLTLYPDLCQVFGVFLSPDPASGYVLRNQTFGGIRMHLLADSSSEVYRFLLWLLFC